MLLAYRLARADTNTPVSWWMGRPLRELKRWLDVVVEEQKRTKG